MYNILQKALYKAPLTFSRPVKGPYYPPIIFPGFWNLLGSLAASLGEALLLKPLGVALSGSRETDTPTEQHNKTLARENKELPLLLF